MLRTDNVFMDYVNSRLQAQWKRTRGVLSQHWKNNGGKTNPQLARENMKPDCRSQDDWNHLCNYWELEKTRVSMLHLIFKSYYISVSYIILWDLHVCQIFVL